MLKNKQIVIVISSFPHFPISSFPVSSFPVPAFITTLVHVHADHENIRKLMHAIDVRVTYI